MGEVIVGVALALIAVAAILMREQLRADDRNAIHCPRSRSVVNIRDGVCREANSPRIVGVPLACQRECLIRREAEA